MTELLPNIFAIEVPEDSKDHGLVHIFAREDILYWYDKRGKKDSMWINLNAYHAKIMFTTSSVTEEQAASISPGSWPRYFENATGLSFMDYSDNIYRFDNAIKSLQSLLKSKRLTAGNYLIIKKNELAICIHSI